MNIRVGYIPYLNMVPFHHGFGPEPVEARGRRFEFHQVSPRVLGLEAAKGTLDAGALSLVDWLRGSSRYEPIGRCGIGVQRSAQSVLLFSNRIISHFQGQCAVTDDTATSFRLLQLLLEVRYALQGIHYGRVASSLMYDGTADGLLLIGDEALRAKKDGIRGLPFISDLGEEWYQWHQVPFVFARWAMRSALRQEVKEILESSLQKSLRENELNRAELAAEEALKREMTASAVMDYWKGFAYELTPEHERSIAIFAQLMEKACSTA